MFYWTEADYNAATTLSPNNATGKFTLTGTNSFAGLVDGISAKNLDDTIYVAASIAVYGYYAKAYFASL